MTGGTTSTHGHITLHTALVAHGTGADIGVHTGACRRGAIHGTTHGTTDGTTHGITEDIGDDGMTRSATGDTGVGTTHGTTEDTGEYIIHGIRTMPDGTADSILTGDMVMVPDLVMEDTSRPTGCIPHDMRHRATTAYLPAQARQP